MSCEDYLTLVDSQVNNAYRSIYTSKEVDAETLDILRNRLREKEDDNGCWTDERNWMMRLAGLSRPYRFSFFAMTPPVHALDRRRIYQENVFVDRKWISDAEAKIASSA